jgi:hypothetical protein
MRLKIFLVLVFAFCALPSYAQYRAGIQGVIVDPQGSVVEGATVTLTSNETNISKMTTSDSSGVYNFLSLAPGDYGITVEKGGFKKKSLQHVVVAAEQTQAVNITLEVGEVTQSVTVSADVAPAIDTETGQISGTLTTSEIQNLPSLGRDPYQLLRLAPGVFGDAAHNNGGGSQNTPGSAGPGGSSATSSIFQTENQVQINANGQRNIANSFQIDGVEVNSLDWGGAAIVTPNEESVKEVRVTSSQYSAENGRNSGAQVEVVSKNGTNEYHGSLFIKIDRPGLDAFQKVNNPNNPLSVQRVSNRFNQIGGGVGGPIIKNRLFGFFSYETVRNSSVSPGTAWVETPQLLKAVGAQTGFIAGGLLSFPGEGASITTNLNGTCAQVNLPATNCQAVSGGLDIGSPLSSSTCPTIATAHGRGTLDPTYGGGAITPFGVGCGLDGTPDVEFVQTSNPTNSVATQWNGRADYQVTNKDLVAYSIYWVPNDSTFLNGPARPANLWHSDRLNYSEALLWNHTFASSMINEARFNVSRWYFNELASNPQEPWGLPLDFINCAPGSSLCPSNYGSQGPGIFYKTAYNIRDTLSRVQGRHTLKFGVDIYKEQNKQTNAGGARPDYVFRSMWDFANDAPIQEFGDFTPTTGVPTSVTGYIRSNIYALFVQDDFKLKPNLTVNLGLRWEYFGPFHEKFGNLSHPVLGAPPDQLTDLTMKLGGDLYNSSYHNFGPQIGFAWSPNVLPLMHHEFHNRLVVRGGFGIGYNRMEDAILLGNLSNPPLESFFNFTGSSAGDILYASPSNTHQFAGWPANPNAVLTFDPTTHLPTTGGPVTLNGVDNNLSTPYTYRYSLEIQYDLGHNWVATVGYQGSLSRHYTRQENLNWNFSPLNPEVNNLFFWTNDVNGNYNALLTELQHHFSNTFELDAQYTYSKSMDDGSFDYNIGDYPFNRQLEYGPSDYDVTHNFKLWGLWSPRIFRGSNAWMEKVVGGWTLSGIWNAHSGFPWTPEYNVQIINSPGGNSCSLIYPGSGFCTVRPAAYLGGAGSNYSNSTFEKPLGNFPNGPASYFTPPVLSTSGIPPAPGIDRNTFRGPRYSSVDFTLGKAFGFPHLPVLGENAKLDIRANFYNIFNQVNFAPLPNQTIGTIQVNALTGVQTNPAPGATTTFGQVQNGLAGRVIEVQARFSF